IICIVFDGDNVFGSQNPIHDGNSRHEVGDVSGHQAPCISDMASTNEQSAPSRDALNKSFEINFPAIDLYTRLTFQRTPLTGKNPIFTRQQIAWTTEEEIALAKGWKAVSENNERGNTRKKDGFWVEVMEYMESKTKMEGRQTYDMESRAGDEDYVQKAMIHYQAETGPPFKFRHCWDVLKDKSGDASINRNSIVVGDDEVVADDDEVQEIRRPVGRDKARAAAKNKGSKVSASSTMNDDALARLVVNEMTSAEVEQREKFIELKRREVECREREIAATEYRAQQEDMKLYLQPYDHLTGEQRLA
ncbi:hypothetical protein Tco_0156489, partial [Tanacetum coccineum]